MYFYIFLITILFLFRFADFSFYQNGFELFTISFLGFTSFIMLLYKKVILKNISFHLTLCFLIALFIINYIYAYYPPDSFLYAVLLCSLSFIFFYLVTTQRKFLMQLLKTIYIIGIINVVFTLLELVLKNNGIFNIELIPYSFYINNQPSLGGIFYQTSFNTLFLNTTAFLSLFYLYNKKSNNLQKAFLTSIYVLSIGLSIFIEIRAAMLAMFICIIMFFTIATFKHFNKAFRRQMVIYFSIYIVLLILNTFAIDTSPVAKFQRLGSEDVSILSRLNIWFAQILIFLDHPFFGVGLDCFKYINTTYQLKSIELLKLPFDAIGNFTTGHNEFLQLLCEGGLLLIIPLIYISWKFFTKIVKNLNENNIFLLLILILFFIHSIFSWELRKPAFMFTFILIISMFLNHDSNNTSAIKLKNIHYVLPFIFIIMYCTFFLTYGSALAKEFYYINKAKNEKNFFISLSYINKLSLNPYLRYGSNHFFIQKSLYFVWDDIFHTQYVPLTKELFKNVDKKKLFHYDKMSLVNLMEEKANNLYNLRPYWFYPFTLAMCDIIKGNYNKAYEFGKKAELLNPNDDRVFALMHLANILEASFKKGIEIEALLPSKSELEYLLNNLKKSKIRR